MWLLDHQQDFSCMQGFTDLTIADTLTSTCTRIPGIIFFAFALLYWHFTPAFTLIIMAILSGHISCHQLHIYIPMRYFASVLNSLTLLIILNNFRFTSSILLRTNVLLTGSSTVSQLPLHHCEVRDHHEAIRSCSRHDIFPFDHTVPDTLTKDYF